MRTVILAFVMAGGLAACDIQFRDDFWGEPVMRRNEQIGSVERDDYGNPILPTAPPPRR